MLETFLRSATMMKAICKFMLATVLVLLSLQLQGMRHCLLLSYAKKVNAYNVKCRLTQIGILLNSQVPGDSNESYSGLIECENKYFLLI